MKIFRQLNEERHMTIVLVTHEPDIAVHAKRLVRFRDGEIQEDRPITHKDDANSLHPHVEV
jgi:putative ABC transport system ATP-binding protein